MIRSAKCETEAEKDLAKTEKMKRERKKVKRDPCSPPSRNIVEEYLAMFGTVPSELSEEEIVARDYLEEIERAKRRIYPRISEFGHME